MENRILKDTIKEKTPDEVIVDIDRFIVDLVIIGIIITTVIRQHTIRIIPTICILTIAIILHIACIAIGGTGIVIKRIHAGIWRRVQSSSMLLHYWSVGPSQIWSHIDKLVEREIFESVVWVLDRTRDYLLHKFLQDQVKLAGFKVTDSFFIAELTPGWGNIVL